MKLESRKQLQIAMNYRRAGNSNLSLSEIGFGCGGNAGLMVRGSEARQCAVIAWALELGVTYFDTAPDYGDGLAEINLGRVLKLLNAKPVITTKVEIRQGDLADIAGHVVRSVEASLKRLGQECVDVVQIHNAPTRSQPAPSGAGYDRLRLDDFFGSKGALEGLLRLREAGKARHLGFVCRGNDMAEEQALIETGMFDLINVPYTMLNPTAAAAYRTPNLIVENDLGGIIDFARDHGVGVAVYSPLAGGILTDSAVLGEAGHALGRPREPTAKLQDAVNRAQKIRALVDKNRSLASAATAFVLAHGGVTTLIGGFSDEPQLEEAVAASLEPLQAGTAAGLQLLWETNFGEPAPAQPRQAREVNHGSP
jgi:L-glyceraldehyde 3-phosphate reductase